MAVRAVREVDLRKRIIAEAARLRASPPGVNSLLPRHAEFLEEA